MSGDLGDNAPNEVVGVSVPETARAVSMLCQKCKAREELVFARLHADSVTAGHLHLPRVNVEDEDDPEP